MNLYKVTEKYMTEEFTDPLDAGGGPITYGNDPLTYGGDPLTYGDTSTPFGSTTIRGAIRPFNEVTNSGPSSRRRVLETVPGTVLFSSYLIKHGPQVYVVGGRNSDLWNNAEIRLKYPILPCDLLMSVATAKQVLTATVPTANVYGYPHFVKGSVVDSQDSYVDLDFSIYCSRAALGLARNKIIVTGGNYYRIRSQPFFDGAQFQVVQAQQLEAPLQTLNFITATGYNPTLDTVINGTTTPISAFVEDAYLYYDHTSERHAHLQPGDKTISIKPTIAPKAGDAIGAYKILTIDMDAEGCSICHCRR